jgi:DNA-binding response OmpR family regulator
MATKQKILIVGSTDFCSSVQGTLSNGREVITAVTSEGAQKICQVEDVDAAVLDAQLPRDDCDIIYELCARGIPFLALTDKPKDDSKLVRIRILSKDTAADRITDAVDLLLND